MDETLSENIKNSQLNPADRNCISTTVFIALMSAQFLACMFVLFDYWRTKRHIRRLQAAYVQHREEAGNVADEDDSDDIEMQRLSGPRSR